MTTLLEAFLQQGQANQQQSLGNIQQASALQGIAVNADKQRREAAFRQEIALAKTPEEQMAVAVKYGGPDTIIKAREQDVIARERLSTQKELGLAKLDAEKQRAADQLESAKRYQDMMHEWRMTQAKSQQERDAETSRYRNDMLKFQQQNADANRKIDIMRLELQGDKVKAEQLRNVDKQVTSFANELQQNKIPALTASISTANDLLKGYEGKDLPGFGVLEGSGKIPGFMRSEESNRVRSSVQAVSNDLLNLYSGLAVTLPEAERRELEEMRGGNFSDKDFKNAWPRIVNRYNSVVGNLKAGANAEVLKEYQARPGAIKLDPLAPAFGVSIPKVASDADFDKLPSGAEFIGPDGKKRRKP
jgi:hypothetical protein